VKKRYSEDSKESKTIIRDHEKNVKEYEKMALGAYNEGDSKARQSNKDKISAEKMKNDAKERAVRIGKDLEKVREKRDLLNDLLRDSEKHNKSLEKKIEELGQQNANMLASHQKEITALKKSVSNLEESNKRLSCVHKIEKGWVKNVKKKGE